jgi:hypothetical protein
MMSDLPMCDDNCDDSYITRSIGYEQHVRPIRGLCLTRSEKNTLKYNKDMLHSVVVLSGRPLG